MKIKDVLSTVIVLTVVVLSACNKAEPTREAQVVLPDGEAAGPRGSLQGVTGLALGMLKLEGTEDAVTPEQATRLLPLWQVIQGGSLQGAAETEAVLKQIEGVLDEDQLAAITGMELTFQDIGTWVEEQGIEMPTRVAGQRGGGAFQNMTEEQRNQFRQEMQNMTPEQRATRLAEMGIQRPEGGGPGGGGQDGARQGGFAGRGGSGFLVESLIELLSERAAE